MVPIRENLAMLPLNVSVAVAIGANEVRRDYLNMAQGFGLRTPPLISPHAVISSSATVEEACFVHVGCHVWTAAMIGYGSILSPHATVAHHTRLGTACFVSTGAHVGASIIVEEEVLSGIGATVSTGVARLGRGCLVGAGAVVIRDTKPDGVYVGNPARLISPIAGSEA
jgi:UDP-perosamine 4-acetyltransferase